MRTSFLRSTRALTIAGAIAGASACSADPTLNNLIKIQGPEAEGVDKGEYHRAGQACLACHIAGGPGKTDFSVAGTIFAQQSSGTVRTITGVDQAQVLLVDGAGATRIAITNCVGNFYITRKDWNPKFPLKVAIAKEGLGQRPMLSLIGRDGSCGGCHRPDRALDSAGNVYFGADNYTPPEGCPVDPNLPLPDLEEEAQ